MTSKLDMAWGTSEPFQMEDPKYGLILSIRSHGRYGLRITDARMFVNELVGAALHDTTITHQLIARYFGGLIVTVTKSVIADYMIRKKISFLEITVYLNELSEICRNEISREFERYGVEIQNFYVEYIAPPKHEVEMLREYKENLLKNNRWTEQKGAFASDFAASFDAGKTTITENRLGDEGTSTQNIGRRICPRCSATLESGMKFCGYCGTRLVQICSACGAENGMHQNFCGNCGSAL